MTDTPNAIERINDLRQRVKLGDDLSKEEMAEAVQLLRGDRAARATTAATKATKAAPIDLNDLFKE